MRRTTEAKTNHEITKGHEITKRNFVFFVSSCHFVFSWQRLGQSLHLDGHSLLLPHQSKVAPHALFNCSPNIGVIPQELFDVLPALAETFSAKGKPRAALLDDLSFDRDVEQIS